MSAAERISQSSALFARESSASSSIVSWLSPASEAARTRARTYARFDLVRLLDFLYVTFPSVDGITCRTAAPFRDSTTFSSGLCRLFFSLSNRAASGFSNPVREGLRLGVSVESIFLSFPNRRIHW
jgi:hypothetical protein